MPVDTIAVLAKKAYIVAPIWQKRIYGRIFHEDLGRKTGAPGNAYFLADLKRRTAINSAPNE